MQICKSCKTQKNDSDFYTQFVVYRKKNGSIQKSETLYKKCKACHNEKVKSYSKAEKYKLYRRDWQRLHVKRKHSWLKRLIRNEKIESEFNSRLWKGEKASVIILELAQRNNLTKDYLYQIIRPTQAENKLTRNKMIIADFEKEFRNYKFKWILRSELSKKYNLSSEIIYDILKNHLNTKKESK